MFWTEDLSLLTDQYEDIKEQQEELKARNRLLQKTYQQEAKRRKAEEQNRLLNLIQSQTTGQLELMTHFMEELEVTESKDSLRTSACPDDCDRNLSEAAQEPASDDEQ